MNREVEIGLPPALAADEGVIREMLARETGLAVSLLTYRLLRRSLDARGRQPLIRLRCQVFPFRDNPGQPSFQAPWRDVSGGPAIIIVGSGPAGYFAALQALCSGLRPIVLERGKDVRSRRRDLKAIMQAGQVDPDSNYCFGEGGAGTYSDGKLYTRSHKRGSTETILEWLVHHGAQPDILLEAHPHIGSNKLPVIVSQIRETIFRHGGEVHFGERVTGLEMRRKTLTGVSTASGKTWEGQAVVLATGHSARDIHHLLHAGGITLALKPFALGLRVEHPQPLIDSMQYGREGRPEGLPAASYRLATQVGKRGVFSFCMCPGGLIVPAATAPGEVVVNGMSMSRRDSPFANSGMVVAVDEYDLEACGHTGVFAGQTFQQETERKMFQAAGGGKEAPAQRLTDFLDGNLGSSLPPSSYIPGLIPAPLHKLLPPFVSASLREGLRDFGRKMKGFHTGEALLVAAESRTSSPVRIPRNPETGMHPDCPGLFPCGEGAGYAGGILSAAMDGRNTMVAVHRYVLENGTK